MQAGEYEERKEGGGRMGESWDRWGLVRVNCNSSSVRRALLPGKGELKASAVCDGYCDSGTLVSQDTRTLKDDRLCFS